jgi:hypothetical protein
LAGCFILALLLLTQFNVHPRLSFPKWSAFVKKSLSQLLQTEKKTITYLGIGVLNGLLPCGLVYMAIAAAVATGTMMQSSVLMFAFGIGTMPIMMATMIFGKYVTQPIRTQLFKLTPYFIAGMAMLLILRGLNLGIPYVSPRHDATHHSCCHQP